MSPPNPPGSCPSSHSSEDRMSGNPRSSTSSATTGSWPRRPPPPEYLVDLPGYGYARMSQEGRDRLRRMIEGYISQSEELVVLFVLVDCRHDIGKIDLDFIHRLGENGIPFAILFTKCDKLGPNALKAQIERDKELLLRDWETMRVFLHFVLWFAAIPVGLGLVLFTLLYRRDHHAPAPVEEEPAWKKYVRRS